MLPNPALKPEVTDCAVLEGNLEESIVCCSQRFFPHSDRPRSGYDGPHHGCARSGKSPLRREARPEPGAIRNPNAYPFAIWRSASKGPLRAPFFSRSSETPPSRPNPAQRSTGAPGAGAAEALYGSVRNCGVLTWTTTGRDLSEGTREYGRSCMIDKEIGEAARVSRQAPVV